MRAPVYRHLDTRASFAGLTFPTEWMVVLGSVFLVAWAGAPTIAMAFGVAFYAVLRGVGYGKPDGHIQHAILYRARQIAHGGRYSAAKRARAPQFPFGPYLHRNPREASASARRAP